MPEYYNVTTNLGDAEIANAIATNTKLNITHIAFGDGNGSVPAPDKARTSLVREVHRQAVTKYERHATNANWIVIETIIPSSIGGFWVREMGIIANGKLISHGSHAPFEKVADPSGVSEYRLRFTQDVTDGSVVEITLDESLIYASQAWVEENFIKRTKIVDNLTTADATKPLSAAQGKALQDSKLGKTENAVSATKLQTASTIAISGAVTGNVDFDGSGNITINTQLKENTAVVRAFCSFNGTGTPVILAESNIASISVSSLKFKVTFKTPMPHADYVINGFASDVNNSNRVAVITMNLDMIPSKTVNGFDFYARYSSNASTNIASPLICFSIVC